jgi:hypothetical protein
VSQEGCWVASWGHINLLLLLRACAAPLQIPMVSVSGSMHLSSGGVKAIVVVLLEKMPGVQAHGGGGGMTCARLAADSPMWPDLPSTLILKAQVHASVMPLPLKDLPQAINRFLPEFSALMVGGDNRHVLSPLCLGVAFAWVDTTTPRRASRAEAAATAAAQRSKQGGPRVPYTPPGVNRAEGSSSGGGGSGSSGTPRANKQASLDATTPAVTKGVC